jgi:transposase
MLLTPGGQPRVFAFDGPCDMRKSFNTLSGLVSSMGHHIQHGDVFLFVARNRRRAKVLWHDGTGLCLLAKRIDQGIFSAIWEQDAPTLTLSELSLFLEGCEEVGRIPLSPPPIDFETAGRLSPQGFV